MGDPNPTPEESAFAQAVRAAKEFDQQHPDVAAWHRKFEAHLEADRAKVREVDGSALYVRGGRRGGKSWLGPWIRTAVEMNPESFKIRLDKARQPVRYPDVTFDEAWLLKATFGIRFTPSPLPNSARQSQDGIGCYAAALLRLPNFTPRSEQ